MPEITHTDLPIHRATMVVHPEILDGVDLMARGAIASRLLLPHIVQVVADYTRDGELPVFSGFRAV